jgi:hypothetical protein
MRNTRFVRLHILICWALFFNGYKEVCSGNGNSSDSDSPQASSFPRAITGFDYPLEEPLDEETNGILLRLKPVDHTLIYEDKMVMNMPALRDSRSTLKATQQTTTSRSSRRVTSGSQEGTLIVETTSVHVLDDAVFKQLQKISKRTGTTPEKTNTTRQVIVIGTRGQMSSTFSLETNKVINSSSTNIKSEGEFPEAPVKVGEIWDASQENESQMTIKGKDSTHRLVSKTKWRLSGFATVRKHRCAVLEEIGQSEVELTGNVASESRHKDRTVEYFDYSLGVLVERISYAVHTMQIPSIGPSSRESQMIISLVE